MDDTIELVNVEKLCRLCLSGDEPTLPILDYLETSVPLADRIQTYLSIEILSDDKLSMKICMNCINTLNHWHLYRESCLQSQEKLQKWLAKQASTAEALAIDVKREPMEDESDDEELETEESFRNESEVDRQTSRGPAKGRQRKQIHRVRRLHQLANAKNNSHEDDDEDDDNDDDNDDDDDIDNDDEEEEPFTLVEVKVEPPDNQQSDCNIVDEIVPEQNDCDNQLRSTRPSYIRRRRDTCMDTLPAKSKTRYLSTYETFSQWMESEGETSFAEDVLLSYFIDLDSKYCPTTLWSMYSMLKTTIIRKHNVDISTYSRLLAYIKKKMTGFKRKKPKVFTPEQIQRFVFEAPDNPYLITKVVAIFGVLGGCRTCELCNIMTRDIKDFANSILKITVWKSKTEVDRTFTVEGYCYKIIKKYMNLRPSDMDTLRFFVNYRNGKCTRQVIGKNKIALCPKQVADFLLIPNSNEYTGQSFRKTSPVSLSDSAINLARLPMIDRLTSNTDEKSANNKRKIANKSRFKKFSRPQVKPLIKKIKTEEVEAENSHCDFETIDVDASRTVDAAALSELDETLEITPINNDAKIILSTSSTDSTQKPVYNFYNCTIKSSKL